MRIYRTLLAISVSIIAVLIAIIMWKEKRHYGPPQATSNTQYDSAPLDTTIGEFERIIRENQKLIDELSKTIQPTR